MDSFQLRISAAKIHNIFQTTKYFYEDSSIFAAISLEITAIEQSLATM
jgi:hypothetical protein